MLKVTKDSEKLFKANVDSDEVAVSGPYKLDDGSTNAVLSVGTKDEGLHMIVLDEQDVFTVVRALLNHVGYEPTFGFADEGTAQAG